MKQTTFLRDNNSYINQIGIARITQFNNEWPLVSCIRGHLFGSQ